jgi:hypothetical protein
MSTRSTITVRTGKNERKSIYCHSDGYPSYTGKMLLEHYSDQAKLEKLVSLGDLSVLKKNIDPKGKTHNFEYSKREEDVCVFCGRDRGDIGFEAVILTNEDAIEEQEWNYYFDGKEWFYYSENGKKSKENLPKLTKADCQ